MARSGIEQTVARGVAWVSVAAGVVAICDLVSLALLLRFWLHAETYGTATLVVTVFGALQLLVEAGLPAALIQRGDEDDETRTSTAFWLGIAIGCGVYAVIWVVSPLIAGVHGDPEIAGLFRGAGVLLVIRPFYTVHQARLRRHMRFGPLSKVRVVANLVELGVKVGTAAAGAGAWCFVLGAIARELIYAIGVPLVERWRPRLVFAMRSLAGDFRFGFRATGAELIYQVYSNLDYQVVGYVFGPAAVGQYRAAYELVLEPVRFLSSIVTTIAFPTFARLRTDRHALVEQFIAFTRQNLAVVLLLVGAIVVSAPDVLALVYGEGYAGAATAARVLAIVGILRALSHLGPPLLDGVGRPDLSLRYQTIAATSLAIGYAVAANVGTSANAVAWAWAAGYPIAFCVLVAMVLARLELDALAYARRFARLVALIAVACAVGLVIRSALPDAGRLTRFLASSGTMVVLGATLLAVFEGFSPAQIRRRLRGG